MSKDLTTECYLILEPTYDKYSGDLSGFKVAKVSQRQPKNSSAVLKLDVTVPAEMFSPFVVTADIKATKKNIEVKVGKPKLTRKGEW
jgi:hypothetical protein